MSTGSLQARPNSVIPRFVARSKPIAVTPLRETMIGTPMCADFITILRRALSGSPGLADEARRWAGHLTEAEAAGDPTFARLRAVKKE